MKNQKFEQPENIIIAIFFIAIYFVNAFILASNLPYY
jgi:hypothetical protein